MGLSSRTRLLAFAGLLGVVTFLLGPELETRALRLGSKAVPLLCMLLWLWPARERYARLIRVGLVLSLLGDLLLEASPDLFLPALGAFLLAHVAYVTAYVTVTRRPSLARGVPFALLGLGLGVLLWPGLGGLALPVTAYIAVICAMMWRSAAMLGGDGLGRREQWAALAGALMFAASDTLLALRLFMQPVPGSSYAIILLYWAGQLGITLSARSSRALELSAPVVPSPVRAP
ncbi:MAG TPA: lysoplasmalogenase [Myxococcaceae bacterium]|nr:lysoplasmalogenase [Myxococcaceae bacterium]